MLLYDVGLNNYWQGICDILKHKCVLGASHWRIYKCCGMVLKLIIHYKGQHSTWGLCVCGVYTIFQPMDCLQDVLPKVMWDAHLVAHLYKLVLQEILKNDLLWESILSTKDPSLSMNSDYFQWWNIKHGGFCMSDCIKCH